jgi:ABC-2 type transport system permease protein
MILTVVRISLLRLWHNKAELVLTFIVPIIFFSIFALIFGSRERSGVTSSIKVALVYDDTDNESKGVAQQLNEHGTLRFVKNDSQVLPDGQLGAVDLKTAEALVKDGSASVAIVLKRSNATAKEPALDRPLTASLLTDSSDQVAPKIVLALLNELLITKQVGQIRERLTRASPPTASGAPPTSVPHGGTPATNVQSSDGPPGLARVADVDWSLPVIAVEDVVGGQRKNPVVAMYASGIAVMFLLFSVVGGGGALLEEKENSTLERLLASQLTMDELLMGKWLYLVIIGSLQTTLMFAWGQLIFGVELLEHWEGFVMMTLVTAAAASSFALCLATLCSSRAQLNWVSIVLVLGMSALGGSMVPRYLMSERIREFGLLTFNAWALDGYNKVFWRNLPLQSLWPQLAVLSLAGLLFMITARLSAKRWERI